MSNNEPPIRFAQYSGKWEECKIGSCFTERNESDPDGELISVTINSGIKRFSELGRKDTSNDDKSHYKKVVAGDIAYNSMRMWQGASGYSPYDGIVSPAYTVITPNESTDSRFFSYLFKRKEIIKIFRTYSQGISSDNWNLKYPALKDIDVVIPNTINEQKDIASFLRDLDDLIAFHQVKLEKTKMLMVGLRQKLFTSLVEPEPNIRFEEYDYSWKKTSLHEIISPYTDYLPTPTDGYTRLGIRSHMKGTFYEYVAPSKRLGEKRLQRVKRDNFIVNIVFAWEHAIAVTTEEDEGKLVSHRFPQFSFNAGMYPRFFHYALNDERFRHHLWLASPSGAGRNKTLRVDEMMEYELLIPEYEEQKKIADFLTALDELIDLYEARITKLQNIKAACLQGMFV